MKISGKHDDGISEHIGCVWTGENALLCVCLAVATGKLLHDPVDLLSFTGQTEVREEVADGSNKVHVGKIHLVNVVIHHRLAIAMDRVRKGKKGNLKITKPGKLSFI